MPGNAWRPAGGLLQPGPGRAGGLRAGAVEVDVVQDGVDVQEHEHDVAGVPGVEGDLSGLVVAAGPGYEHGG